MRLVFVAHHLPHPQAQPAGRILYAVVEQLRELGHDATAWSWGDRFPELEPPAWCERRVAPAPARSLRRFPRTLLHPRQHLTEAGWRPPAGAVVIADNRDSAAAVPHPHGVVLHHSVRLDAAATGQRGVGVWQERRAERHAVAAAGATAGLSDRVRLAVGADVSLPATMPMPTAVLPIVEAPVALLLADWSWPPNQVALNALLPDWPIVRAEVPGARLLIAGRQAPAVDLPGVTVIGPVATTVEAMAQAGLLVFPCPPSSGPKLKVLDAMAAGLPVLTTPAGVEGLHANGVAVAGAGDFTRSMVALLRDPGRRSALATQARASAVEHHRPATVAKHWLAFAQRAAGSGG